MTIRGTLFALFAAALVVTLAWLWFAPASPNTRPDISLMTIKGEEIQLASLQGRPLLVTFWATTCSPCVREIPHLIELYKDLAPQGLEIIGIAMDYDPPNRVVDMSKARNIPYPIALDIHGDAARAFGNIHLTPTSFLIAPDGRIVYRKLGTINMVSLRKDILDLLGTT